MNRTRKSVHKELVSSVSPSIRGFLDFVDPSHGIEGWLLDFEDISKALTISVIINSVDLGEASFNVERSDVSTQLQISARPGFEFLWSSVKSFPVHQIQRLALLELRLSDNTESLFTMEIEFPPHLRELSETQAISEHVRQSSPNVKIIAFYLPQYHPVPENNRWWGEGFTEWQNVARGKPAFPGHYQPHIPADLGFYDLRLSQVREKQAELAQSHGIFGFCYYYYWFSGRKLLDLPLREVMESGSPDFPFCICWANETWSRRWDGSESEILVKQDHNPDSDAAFIDDVIPILKDPRYICVDGRPLLLVYRVSLFPSAIQTAKKWREICRDHNLDIHLCAVESFGISDPHQFGFDSSVEFPPHNNVTDGINATIEDLNPEFQGGIFDYPELVGRDLRRSPPPYTRFKGLMLGWDNSARRGLKANIFINSSPSVYEGWLNGAIEYTRKNLPASYQFVFINAWNEWAEGTHLEPDQKFGLDYLKATLRAVKGTSNWSSYAMGIEKIFSQNDIVARFVKRATAELLIRDRVISHLSNLISVVGSMRNLAVFSDQAPEALQRSTLSILKGFNGNIDRIGNASFSGSIDLDSLSGPVYMSGWFVVPLVEVNETSSFWIILSKQNSEERFFAFVPRRTFRNDVTMLESYSSFGAVVTDWSGFMAYLDFKSVSPGEYRVSSSLISDGGPVSVEFSGLLHIF